MEDAFDIFDLDEMFFDEAEEEHPTAGNSRPRADVATPGANALFELWWREPPLRVVGEQLSTLAKVQIAAFLKYDEWAWRLHGEWRFIASYRRCPTVKGDLELVNYVKTDEYRLSFGKYRAEEGLRLLRSAGEPLKFRCAAPFPLIREACEAHLRDASASAGLREISIQLQTSDTSNTLAVDVCADIYRSLFPCPHCSGPYMTEVFHHSGVNGRELRYELHFEAWDYRCITDGRIERALYPYAHCQA